LDVILCFAGGFILALFAEKNAIVNPANGFTKDSNIMHSLGCIPYLQSVLSNHNRLYRRERTRVFIPNHSAPIS
jgi:hypothetical protein